MDVPQNQPKILIIDNSRILNNLLRDLFKKEGFEVRQAFNGQDCNALITEEKPDVLLFDTSTPQVHAVELLRLIKAKSPETVTVVMTTGGNDRLAARAMKCGANEYLTKPFDTKRLVGLAKKWLEERQARRETARLRKHIREGERYLAHVTMTIHEALITTDPSGRIEFVNLSACAMWGYSADELQGKDVDYLVRGDADTILCRDIVKDTLRYGKIEEEFHFRRKDASTFPGYVSTSVIQGRNRPKGIVLVVSDQTARYEVERRLKQSEKLASLGKVVEGVAHEVRNCLTSLGGFTKRVRKITAEDARCRKYTEIILTDVNRLESMV
ncbi:MAG: response regulator, partial [Pseudomonadota bacterium]